jgi:adenosylcobinamide kinase/adenosylcobinamide-phosphate guanylyltransferase
LTNLLLEAKDQDKTDDEIECIILSRFEIMLSRLKECPGTLVVVANEVGLGIVPEYPLSRIFRDLAGRVNQLLAQKADKVYFVIAGLPLEIKGNSMQFPGGKM